MVTRVLFVGSYDPAGSGIATRLYREGCRVSWLTAEPERELWGSKVHGKVFRRTVNYQQCSQILKGESVDCIVILTGAAREGFGAASGLERGQLLLMLSPLLQAAAAEKVQKVCFLSSLSLEDQALLPPGLEELRAAERVTISFCQEQKLPLLTVRLGCIYGEGMMDFDGVMGNLLRAMDRKEDVACPLTAQSQLDLIQVPDAADAVYRLLNMDAAGQVDLFTGRTVTAQQLCETAARAAGWQGDLRYGRREQHGPAGSGQDVRRLCGWMPFYPFDSHGAEAIARELGRVREREARAGQKQRRRARAQTHSLLYDTAQNLLLFAVAAVVASLTPDWSDLRFVDVRLLYVMIVAITFGMRQGLLATALATVSYLGSQLQAGIDASYVLYNVGSWIPFVIYGVAGAFGGYWSDKKRDTYENLSNEYREQQDRYSLLEDLYRELLDVKNQLQKQIVISRDSFNRLYAVTEDLDDPNPRMVLIRTVRVIEEIMEGGSVAIYLRVRADKRYGRLMACSDQLSRRLQPSLDFEAVPRLQETMQTGAMYVNKELDPQYPAFAMPVSNGSFSIALVELYDLPASQYTIYYRNLFQTLVQMVQHNLVQAYTYQMENREKLFVPGTDILTAEAFARERKTLQMASEEYGYPSSIARILPVEQAGGQGLAPAQLSGRVEPLLRGTDLLGMGQDGQVRAGFLYLDRASRPVVEHRFALHGLRLVWED